MKDSSNKFNCSKIVSVFFVYFFDVMEKKPFKKDMLNAFYKVHLLKELRNNDRKLFLCPPQK